MILAILGVIAVILLLILYRYLPNKKIFACFVATLIAAAAIICSFGRTQPPLNQP